MGPTTPQYTTIRQAIIYGKQIVCYNHGLLRECCPHSIGWTGNTERVLVYQFSGASSRGLPSGGEWRCMDISEITSLMIRDCYWHSGASHTRPQTCIKVVDIDVTTA